MIGTTSRSGAAGVAINEKLQTVSSPSQGAHSAEPGGYLSKDKDQKDSATAAQFGDVWQQIQSKYGEKPSKPREVKKTLGKDDFLRIMITQMKNQDPTNPFKAEQMASEVAQFTSVEQLQNVNQNLNKLATQNKPLEQMSMTNLIGKTVTIDRERFAHLEGENDDLGFKLTRDAKSVNVTIMDGAGEEIFKKDLGSQKAGDVGFIWDGIKVNSLPAKVGNYRCKVDAKDPLDRVIDVNTHIQSKVVGVSFEGTEPVFLVGDSKHQDKVTIKNIARIEMDLPTETEHPPLPGRTQVPIPPSFLGNHSPPSPHMAPPPLNIASNQGKAPIDLNQTKSIEKLIPDEMKRAIEAQMKSAEIKPIAEIKQINDTEKGFPNGLKDVDEVPISQPKGGDK